MAIINHMKKYKYKHNPTHDTLLSYITDKKEIPNEGQNKSTKIRKINNPPITISTNPHIPIRETGQLVNHRDRDIEMDPDDL